MVVKMKPGHWPDIAKMQQTIKGAGYTPIPEKTELVVTGRVARRGEPLAIVLDQMRTPTTLFVAPVLEDPETAAHLERHHGETMKLEGIWQPPPPGQQGPGALAVTAIYEVEDGPK
jgi:hypothetical protein